MCSSGCPTYGAHASWGECIRAKGLHVTPMSHPTNVAWDKELHAYADARRQGVKPMGTRMQQVQNAMIKADLGID